MDKRSKKYNRAIWEAKQQIHPLHGLTSLMIRRERDVATGRNRTNHIQTKKVLGSTIGLFAQTMFKVMSTTQ